MFDLYRDGLTQGSIGLFLDCRHQFYLKYVLGLSGANRANTTAYGSAFHDMLALTQHRTTATGEKLAPIPVDAAARKHVKSLGPLPPTQEEDVTFMVAKVRETIKLYNDHYAKEHAKWKWVARELAFNVPFKYQHWIPYELDKYGEIESGGPLDVKIPIRGRFDGIYEESKRLKLLETKTKGRVDEMGITETLGTDIQTQLYLWAAKKVLNKELLGVKYDVIKTSALKLGKTETKKQHLARMVADIQSRPKEYFMRWDVTMKPGECDQWAETWLTRVIGQIVEWWESIKGDLNNPFKSPLHFINPRALYNQYGRCDLFFAVTRQQYFDCVQRKHIYPELVD